MKQEYKALKSNSLSHIRALIDGGQGHNYALPDCIKFIFEHMGEYEFLDFWDIAAVTGDVIAQVYNRNVTTSCEYCVSGYLAGRSYISDVFHTLGFACEYVSAGQFNAAQDGYLQKIVNFIDRDIPVLVKTNLNDIPAWKSDVGTYCLIVGYEKGGRTLKLLIHDTVVIDYEVSRESKLDFVFVGQKLCTLTPEKIYMYAIVKMPYWLTQVERNGMFFGAEAYRAWADDIEAGRFENGRLPLWENYGVYVCNLATSGAGMASVFSKLAAVNDTFSHWSDAADKIWKLMPTERFLEGRSLLWMQLDELGGSMDMEAVKATMQDQNQRLQVAGALRDYAGRLDQALALINEWSDELMLLL